jgi:hypothetical protein
MNGGEIHSQRDKPCGLHFMQGVCGGVFVGGGGQSGPACDGGVCISVGDPFILNSSSRE